MMLKKFIPDNQSGSSLRFRFKSDKKSLHHLMSGLRRNLFARVFFKHSTMNGYF